MKKGLSILLVAAALFGFYGSAVNLNDVLACKDYWEKAGEESTANMNKLEDGLNQLKENEQAYLDGKQQVADGEVALAEGEATLAEGEATLAQGEADYAAAPGKLADARQQIAAGEAALSDGKDAINGLTKLINGINKLRKGYNKDWKPGYEALKDGRNQIYEGTKGLKDKMVQLAAFLDDKSLQPGYVAAVNDVAGDDEKQSAKDFKDFIKNTNLLEKDIPVIQKSVSTKLAGAKQLKGALSAADSNLVFAGTVANDAVYPNLKAFAALIQDEQQKAGYLQAVEGAKNAYETYAGLIEKDVTEAVTAYMAPLMSNPPDTSSQAYKDMAAKMAEGKSQSEAIAAIQEEKTNAEKAAAMQKYGAAAEANEQLTAARQGINGAVDSIVKTLTEVDAIVNGDAVNGSLLPGLKKFNAAATSAAVDKLSEGQDTISGGVATVASAVLGNKTLKAGVKKNFGGKAVRLLKKYRSSNGPLSTKVSDFAAFEKQMDSNPGVNSFLLKAQKLLTKTRTDGIKTYNAGKKKLDDGQAQYAQGLKDYAEAPAKLADGRKQLEEGRKALEEGRQTLADGKAQLAQYEDGEQQVRDGLKTLTDTEADLSLESIADRLKGDVDFDNGDNHLELDEGLAAVEIGRGYQAEDGVLITEEIMGRAIGTGALLGAGVLAVLAAILSFLKKNKAAGVFAVLAAAAGAFGAFFGSNAGTYFSSIAGSTVGATGWVAAGVLGAVALVHAIAHFVAPKNA